MKRALWINLLIPSVLFTIFMAGCKPVADDDLLTGTNQANTVTDIDNNVYNTVAIGTQVWMVENLRTTRFNDGNAIKLVTSQNTWTNTTSAAYCWYNNEPQNKNIYGTLYNGYTITNKLCPVGWHVPSLTEINTLFNYVRNYYSAADRPEDIAGGMLKDRGTSLWGAGNLTYDWNTFGFKALPGGFRSYDFLYRNWKGYWWTTDKQYTNERTYFSFQSGAGNAAIQGSLLFTGYSVRCLKN